MTDVYLKHHGVKGMKWGVTRDEATLLRLAGTRPKISGGDKTLRKELKAQAKSDWKDYKRSTTRKERQQDRKAALRSKFDYILEAALENPDRLIINNGKNPTVISGKRFVDHLDLGGSINPKHLYLA